MISAIFVFILCYGLVILFVLFAPARLTRLFFGRKILWFMVSGGFILAGTAVAFGFRAWLAGAEMRALVIFGVIAFIFLGAGGDILYELFLKRRLEVIEAAKLKQMFPDAPWKWDKRWEKGRLVYSDKSEMIFSWVVAGVLNLGMLIAYFILRDWVSEELHEDIWGGLCIIYAFVMMGLFALRYAINCTIKWRAFGTATFEMKTVPGIIGGRLEGMLHTHCRKVPAGGFDLRLSCVEMDVTFRDSPSEILETVLWEAEKKIRIDSVQMGPHGICFPVLFVIPAVAKETDTTSRERRVHWILNVTGCDPDHLLQALFRVPVFRLRESQPEREALSG